MNRTCKSKNKGSLKPPRRNSRLSSSSQELSGGKMKLRSSSRRRLSDLSQFTIEVDTTPEYKVERILDKGVNHEGVTFYLLKWEDYPSSENSWIPQENLSECDELIEDFEKVRLMEHQRDHMLAMLDAEWRRFEEEEENLEMKNRIQLSASSAALVEAKREMFEKSDRLELLRKVHAASFQRAEKALGKLRRSSSRKSAGRRDITETPTKGGGPAYHTSPRRLF